MTGAGTQAEPFLVDNIADFRVACAETDAYIRVIADMDCEKENYLQWYTLNSNAIEVDFDGHMLKNPMIAESNRFLNGQNKTILKNGKILNIYENACTHIISNATLINTAVSTELKRIKDTPFVNISAANCNFNILHNHMGNIIDMSQMFHLIELNNVNGLQDTRIEINGIVVDDIITANASTVEVRGCRIEGKVNYDSSRSMQTGMIYATGKLRNSVIALEIEDIGSNSGISLCRNAGNTNIVRSDICVLKGYYGALQTDASILDPASNIALGFDVVEVSV